MKNSVIKIILLLSVMAFTSYIAAAQNKSGFVSLFDGKTLKGWKNINDIDKAKGFKVIGGGTGLFVNNGVIKGISDSNESALLATENEYGDFILELDVKSDGTVADAGIQLHGQIVVIGYSSVLTGTQCEIDPHDKKWTGGIFDTYKRGWLYPVDLNAKAKNAFKTGIYNHIKIECIGSVTKTWVNGIATAYIIDTIHAKGFIGLQLHGISNDAVNDGTGIYFKNIKIKTTNLMPTPFPKGIYVVNLQPNTLSEYEMQNGWKLLFDGKTSAGWRSATKPNFPEKGWDISNGIIMSDPQVKDQPSGGDIITEKKYHAFDLSFEFKTTPAANSGVKYFVKLDEKSGAPIGLEYQVLDDALNPDAKLGRYGNRTESSLYDLIPAKKPVVAQRPVGEWNIGRIIVYPNNHVEHYLNGVKVLEYDRGSPAFRDSVAISKFKNFPNFAEAPEGYILLQDHGCVVSYRNIKLRELN